MTAPRNNERKTRGRPFAPGNAGRPKGARHRVTLAAEAMLDGEGEKLTRKAIDMALAGDTVALRLCLERLVPPRKDTPISFKLPAVRSIGDLVGASAAIVSAVAGGKITPDEAGRVMTILTAHRAIIETTEIERRLENLEAWRGK